MNTEKPIEDWLSDLPEPIRTEALEARRKAKEDPEGPKINCAQSMAGAICVGFNWLRHGGDIAKWSDIHDRARRCEFDKPAPIKGRITILEERMAELDKTIAELRAMIAEAEKRLNELA